MSAQRIPLGAVVKDRVTGFSGTATQRNEQLYGVTMMFVEGRDSGTFIRQEWIPESRLDVLSVPVLAGVASIAPVEFVK